MKRLNFIAVALILCALIILTGCAGTGQHNSDKEPSGTTETASEKPSAEAQESVETQQAEAGQVIEPEQLISKAEAETLMGVAAKDGEKTDNAVVGQKLCFYDAADEDSDIFLQIAITQQAFMPEGSPNTPESIYETTKEYFGGDSAVVEGYGDETILVTGGYYIMVDGYLLQMSAGNTDDDSTKALLNAASELAVANLKAIIG